MTLRTPLRSFQSAAVAAFALLLVACGGGSGGSSGGAQAPAATSLKYTDPSGTGWRLVQDSASTPTHLVLDLVGPAGTPTRGAAFNLQSDTSKISWGHLSGAYVEDLGVFELAADPTDPNEPRLLVGGAKGNQLSVADLQKQNIYSSKDAGQPLFRVAIDFNAFAKLHAGETVPLTVTKAKHLGDDFLSVSVPIATGTLVAQ